MYKEYKEYLSVRLHRHLCMSMCIYCKPALFCFLALLLLGQPLDNIQHSLLLCCLLVPIYTVISHLCMSLIVPVIICDNVQIAECTLKSCRVPPDRSSLITPLLYTIIGHNIIIGQLG